MRRRWAARMESAGQGSSPGISTMGRRWPANGAWRSSRAPGWEKWRVVARCAAHGRAQRQAQKGATNLWRNRGRACDRSQSLRRQSGAGAPHHSYGWPGVWACVPSCLSGLCARRARAAGTPEASIVGRLRLLTSDRITSSKILSKSREQETCVNTTDAIRAETPIPSAGVAGKADFRRARPGEDDPPAIQKRYAKASRKAHGQILDEFVQTTRSRRAHAAAILSGRFKRRGEVGDR